MRIDFYKQLNDLKEIPGYKSFNLDRTNCYGKIFEEGKKYHCDGEIKFGPRGNGFHYAERFEDTIRYSGNPSSGSVRDVAIAKVIGSGTIVSSFDDYNEYFDMYACSDLYVDKFLTRDEIISLALDLPELRMCRFLSLYKLTSDEIALFKNKNNIVERCLYYQYLCEENNGFRKEMKRNT